METGVIKLGKAFQFDLPSPMGVQNVLNATLNNL